ncbi:MAG: hypothetical protein ACRDYC_04955 [Acidimicrobiales bacterium]
MTGTQLCAATRFDVKRVRLAALWHASQPVTRPATAMAAIFGITYITNLRPLGLRERSAG